MNAFEVRIALADDDADARVVLARMIKELGYVVSFSAENGEELLSFDSLHEVAVVLLDLDMPELDGLATAEEVTRRGIPVILVSGHPDLRDVVVDQEPLIAAVAKPIVSTELGAAIQRALESRQC